MRLIYITNARIPTEKAHGVQIMKMCEAFSLGGVQILLIIPKRRNSIKEDPMSYYGIKQKFPIRKSFSIDLFGFIPDRFAFLIQWLSFSFFAVLGIFFHSKKDAIFYSRDYLTLFFLCLFGLRPVAEIHDYRTAKSKWLMGYLLKRTRKLILNSEGTKELLVKDFEILPEKMLVAPNGVDIDFFDIPETREEARRKLMIPQEKIILGYFGNLETAGIDKGVSQILDAFSQIWPEFKECDLYVIGGPEARIRYFKEFQIRLKIPGRRVIFRECIPHREVPFFFRSIDIFIIPSPIDIQYSKTTSPMKIFEFLAGGKVIIAPDMTSLRFYLNEKNALFFEPGNASSLAQKLKSLIVNPEQRKSLSIEAFFSAGNHSWKKRVEKIKKFIGIFRGHG